MNLETARAIYESWLYHYRQGKDCHPVTATRKTAKCLHISEDEVWRATKVVSRLIARNTLRRARRSAWAKR